MRAFPVRIEANIETGLTPRGNKGSGLSADCELIAVDSGDAETTNPEGLVAVVLEGKCVRARRVLKGKGSEVRVVGFKRRECSVRDHHVISQDNNIGSGQDEFACDVELEITVD